VVEEHLVEDLVPSSHYGFIDTSGAVVIQPRFDFATDFSEGLAAVGVRKNNVMKYGYIDKTGTWVIEPQYDATLPFSEGLAPVALAASDSTSVFHLRWGYIDKTGTVVIPTQYEFASDFSGGIARVIGSTDETGADPASPSYIDKTGKVIWRGQ
jgi:WG containing repeat